MQYPDDATPLDPDEMDGLKFKHINARGELNHLEQANIEAGIEWMRRSRRTDILSETYICELHKHLFGDVWRWAGTFRRTCKNIGVDPLHISVQLRLLLDDMRYWIEHETYSSYEAAIRFHHRLVWIHPFPNGNGRHARIMADVMMINFHPLTGQGDMICSLWKGSVAHSILRRLERLTKVIIIFYSSLPVSRKELQLLEVNDRQSQANLTLANRLLMLNIMN